jgi:hypothetical protein
VGLRLEGRSAKRAFVIASMPIVAALGDEFGHHLSVDPWRAGPRVFAAVLFTNFCFPKNLSDEGADLRLDECIAQRWSRFAGQFGGLAKVDSGFDYASRLRRALRRVRRRAHATGSTGEDHCRRPDHQRACGGSTGFKRFPV